MSESYCGAWLPCPIHGEAYTEVAPERAFLEALWNGDIRLTAEQRRRIREALDAQDDGGGVKPS